MDRSAPQAAATEDDRTRGRGIERATFTAIATNAVLALGQLIIGLFANAFSLVADAVHSLSDLSTDLLVLLAGRRGASPADRDHPYGHGRIETIAALLLGLVLVAVGLGFLWGSGVRLQSMDHVPDLHPAALYMALLTLVAKEALFRYTLAAARRLKAPLLEANAWHARSDAASSLIVAVGIGGSLAGYPFLEPLAAALVGFLILSMGLRVAWRAGRELIDTGLGEAQLARLRETIRGTPGVIDLHDLRTRRMADRVLCDTHIQVDARITVSEGHYISDAVYKRVREAHPDVRDVLVHIDTEHDGAPRKAPPPALPGRAEVVRAVRSLLGDDAPAPLRVQVHYLGGGIEVEAIFPRSEWTRIDPETLARRVAALRNRAPEYRAITFFVQAAP